MAARTKPALPGSPLRSLPPRPAPTISPPIGSYNGPPGRENAPSRWIGRGWHGQLARSWVTKLGSKANQPRGDYDEVIRLQNDVLLGLSLLKNVNHVQLKRPFAGAVRPPAADHLHALLIRKIGKAAGSQNGLARGQVFIDGNIDGPLVAYLAPHIDAAQQLVRQVEGDHHRGPMIIFLFQLRLQFVCQLFGSLVGSLHAADIRHVQFAGVRHHETSWSIPVFQDLKAHPVSYPKLDRKS